MDDSERQSVRTAAEAVEGAHFQVAELMATGNVTLKQPECHIEPTEMAALKEIDANLREACYRLWKMSQTSGGS
jgi:hypothetical protein